MKEKELQCEDEIKKSEREKIPEQKITKKLN